MATSEYSTYGANPAGKADGKRSGSTIDPGPYEAIVLGHVVGTRMGQLIVTIPELSGIPNAPTTQADNGGSTADGLVVSYASPFFGQTYGTNTGTSADNPYSAGQSYGMWMVPPDIGCTVLVTFIAGDLSRGYWFACVYNTPSHHMVPGIGRDIGGAAKGTKDPKDSLDQYLDSSSVTPVMEADISETNIFSSDGLTSVPRYPHESQTYTYIGQGLDEDPVRGAISSSSLRESPSNVYGISTPGRKGSAGDQYPGAPQAVTYRSGGHQFVMDDGAAGDANNATGTDQLIRLRTAGGHQILMNDTTADGQKDANGNPIPDGPGAPGIIYIGSKSGSQWLEFSATGAINIYGAGGFNLRAGGPMNLHSDSGITMNAPHIALNALPSTSLPTTALGALGVIPSISINSVGTFSTSSMMATSIKSDMALSLSAIGLGDISVGGALKIGAGGALSVGAQGILSMGATGVTKISGTQILLNSPNIPPTPPIPIPALPPIPNLLPDTVYGTKWTQSSKVLSTCSVVPAHEPWTRYRPSSSLSGLAAGLASGAVSGGGSSGSPSPSTAS
jgi:Type VI secretion system/phage-baseplate injector OB domain